MNVFVVRHGETTWNREGRYQGRQESPLTQVGMAQANAAARALQSRGVRRVVSSPLSRCRDTARPLAELVPCETEIDLRLAEIAHGTWEGRLRSEVERDDGARAAEWRSQPERVAFPGGERLTDVLARWRAFADALGGNNDVAVVTHDVLVRLALLDATDRPLSRLWEPRVVNGGYARFRVDRGRWTLVDECVDAHLGTLLVDPAAQAL